MLRGVAEFTPQELVELQGLATIVPNPEPMLTQKLQGITEKQTSHIIELSADEVEQLLDALPIPSTSSPLQKELRSKLTQFLQSMH